MALADFIYWLRGHDGILQRGWRPPREGGYFLPNVAIYRLAQHWTLENNTIDNGHGMVFVETGSPEVRILKNFHLILRRRNKNFRRITFVERVSCLLKLIER